MAAGAVVADFVWSMTPATNVTTCKADCTSGQCSTISSFAASSRIRGGQASTQAAQIFSRSAGQTVDSGTLQYFASNIL